ncbi:WxL domain-containing protein [Enterococcus durans]|uniref:WxL domain-containing protein n=1 Tax=Enterococcus durans TaxID=53345 RepID=UPI0023310281|nr:WxL domain-containing protein [Enterococcus durans]MDB1654097.1 WxL domain-containing protein [Enterococcus durans]MDB1654427.1 WxL domain-containing protein [Enterococcus durans]MDB1664045.1 WxL domain-containing protein [Enterococcus durans]MDB1668377.1 WxL domain-containing protein [Enterococcus durans]MDB1671692.1 WxL domain-containing protein [Enterococcus durans]
MKKTFFLTLPLLSIGVMCSSATYAATDGGEGDPKTRETPVTATLTIEGENPMPPNPDTNGPKPGDTGAPKGPFGISYVPLKFETKATNLNDSGEQIVPFEPTNTDESFHVGVKDKTRDTRGWTLTAKLDWESAPEGFSVKFDNQSDTEPIKNNVGTAAEAKLESLTDKNGSKHIVSGDTTKGITLKRDGTPVAIMSAENITSGDASYNGVYDYKIGKASLVIPDTSKVKAGSYTGGKVTWNLELTPTTK